jgi:hypothetical protein
MACASLLPLFFFHRSYFSLDRSKQPKSHPLESITYELLFPHVFENSFCLKHFHTPRKIMGGVGGARHIDAKQNPRRL